MRTVLIQNKCVEALKGETHMPASFSAAEKIERNDKALSATWYMIQFLRKTKTPLKRGREDQSLIVSENVLNMYLNPMIHGSILTEDKNFTKERGGEDREVVVSGSPNARSITIYRSIGLRYTQLNVHLNVTHILFVEK
jgi:hypothetical protein